MRALLCLKAWVNTFNRDDYVNSKEPVMLNKKLQPHPWCVGDMSYRELLTEVRALLCLAFS